MALLSGFWETFRTLNGVGTVIALYPCSDIETDTERLIVEIAFLPLPELKSAPNGAPTALSGEEFSLLFGAMLKPSQAGELMKTALPETSGQPVVLDETTEQALSAAPVEAVEAEEDDAVPEEAEEAISGALLNVLPKVHTVFAAPVGPSPEAALSVQTSEGGCEPVLKDTSPPVSTNIYFPVQHAFTYVDGVTGPQSALAKETAATAEAVNGVSPRINDSRTENALSAVESEVLSTATGKMELAGVPLNETVQHEHFEIEIPAEDILKQALKEPETGPAIAASGLTVEAAQENDGRSMSFGPEVENPGQPEKAEKVMFEEVKSLEADLPGSAFQGSESNGREEQGDYASANSASVPETSPSKPEQMMSVVSFDKLVDSPVKETPAAPQRLTPVAAEVQEKVQAGIKVSVEQGGGEVRMKLNPESLGEVRIKLSVASGVVKAEIIVENPEVKRIIESDTSFLRDSLGSHGLTLDKCVVEVGRSQDARGRDTGSEQSFSGDEHRPMKDRDEKGNSAWQRNFRQKQQPQADGGVDFFI